MFSGETIPFPGDLLTPLGQAPRRPQLSRQQHEAGLSWFCCTKPLLLPSLINIAGSAVRSSLRSNAGRPLGFHPPSWRQRLSRSTHGDSVSSRQHPPPAATPLRTQCRTEPSRWSSPSRGRVSMDFLTLRFPSDIHFPCIVLDKAERKGSHTGRARQNCILRINPCREQHQPSAKSRMGMSFVICPANVIKPWPPLTARGQGLS